LSVRRLRGACIEDDDFAKLGLLGKLKSVAHAPTVLAALGCALLQVCAVVFHVSRGEVANTPFDSLIVALSLFVL